MSNESIQQEFDESVQKWREDIQFISSATVIAENRHLSNIVEMGERVIPFIIASIKKEPSLLIIALSKITAEVPVPPEHAGKVQAMTDDWINWYESKCLKELD